MRGIRECPQEPGKQLLERAQELRLKAPLELRGIEKEWPHHAEQARRSYREMLAEAEALEEKARTLADAPSNPHPTGDKEGRS